MSKEIFKSYASFYDFLYKDKDYTEECNFLERIFSRYFKGKVKTILDIGCGTGTHAIILSKRGYEIEGIDISEEMLNIAKRKALKDKLSIKFHKKDIRYFNLQKQFDVVIAMFAVLSYQQKNEDVIRVFKCTREHLKEGGLFVFDAWFGPAVIVQRPECRIKEIKINETEKIIRFAKPILDIAKQIVTVEYRIFKAFKNKILDQVQEVHKLRFFFPKELELFAEYCGFELLEICPFMKENEEVSEKHWNISIIFKKL